MALPLSMNTSSSKMVLQCFLTSQTQRICARSLTPINLVLPRHTLSNFTLQVSRRRNSSPEITSSSSKKRKSSLSRKDDDDDLEEDAFEVVFSQLEDDLKNDDSTVDDDDEINDADLVKLALESEEALGDVDMEKFNTVTEKKEGEEEEEEEEEREVRLKNWQL